MKPSAKKEAPKKAGVEVIENDKVKADAAASKKGKEDSKTAAKPGKSKAKSFPGKKKKMKVCKVVPQPKPKCDTTEYGCCPDGTSPAKGPFESGIFELSIQLTGGALISRFVDYRMS